MATFVKRPTYTSPKGVFKYPSLSKPDYGNEKFPKPDGEFKTSLVVALADAQDLINKLTPEWEAAIEAGLADFAKLPLPSRKKLGALKEQMFYETEFDPETEEETGNVIFKFKTKYKITDAKTKEIRFNKIGLFDSATPPKPLAANTAIYGGTVGKLAFQASPYFVSGQGMAGITLRLSAAQIIVLVGPGNRTAESFGFGGEDGGFEGSDEPEEGSEFSEGDKPAGTNGDPQDF